MKKFKQFILNAIISLLDIFIRCGYIFPFSIILCIFFCSASFHKGFVDGVSMYPTLDSGQIIYTSELFKQIHGIQRGDIVTATFHTTEKIIPVIKRVIALPTEHIKIKDGNVYINNQLLIEPYLSPDMQGKTNGDVDITLGEDEYFLMGDNRLESLDSRYVGEILPVHHKDIAEILIKKTDDFMSETP